MPANTVYVNTRRRPKKRPNLKRRLIIALLALALVAVAIYAISPKRQESIDYSLYPLEYEELIVSTAAQFDLQPAHIAAVVMCESSFRRDVVSYAGAIGLMQIMPDTGGWIAGKFDDIEGYTSEMLLEPEVNLRFGCWYLSWLLDRYGGDMKCATAAYHAGQGNVDKWLGDAELSEDGRTLKSIPIRDTEIYTQRVLEAYEKYKVLYDFKA